MSEKFPIGYKQRYSLIETVSYIGKYLNEINNYFINEKKIIYVDAPIIFNTEHSQEKSQNKRKINFDSKFDNQIYEFFDTIEFPMNQFLQGNIRENKLSIYTYYTGIERDVNQSNSSAIVTKKFYIETQVVEEEINLTNVHSIVNYYIECIKKWNKIVNQHFNINEQKYNELEVKMIGSEEIQNLSKWNSLEKKINDYVEKNQIVLISNVFWKNQQGESVSEKTNVFSDNPCTSVLFIWDKVSKKAIQILKILPHSIENKKTNEVASIAVEICFSNLMKINLEKFHIAEVVSSPWSKEFYEYLMNKKIGIL